MKCSWRLAGGIAALLLGAGCQGPSFRIPFISAEPGLQVKWSEALRRQGVQPLFPLREDVQVGDIYASRVPPGEEARILGERGYVPLDLFLARLDLTEDIGRFYATRILFPETRAFTDGGGVVDRSYFEEGGGGRGADRRMMRLVTFPAFATVHVSKNLKDQELFQFLPPEAMAFLQKSGSWKRARSFTVGTTMAESYGLPAEEAYRRFAKAYGEGEELAKLVDGSMGTGGLPLGTGRKGRSDLSQFNYYVRMITEVYTVRSLDLILRTDLNTGLADGYGGFTPWQGLNLERVNKLLQQNLHASQSGGQLRFVSFGPEGVAMRRVFARPLVMGYRGVVIRVNTLDRSAELHGIIDARMPLPK